MIRNKGSHVEEFSEIFRLLLLGLVLQGVHDHELTAIYACHVHGPGDCPAPQAALHLGCCVPCVNLPH